MREIEIVQAAFEALAADGPEGVLPFLASDVEWTVRPDLPDSETFRGHRGIRALFARFDEVVTDIWYTPQELISLRSKVVVPLRWGGRGRSGATFEEREETWVFTVRGGKISRVVEYPTTDAADRAARAQH